MKKINYKKELEKLTKSIIDFENVLDKEMNSSSNTNRGKRIALLLNVLTLKNQWVMHFVLGYSLEKIDKLYSTNKIRD